MEQTGPRPKSETVASTSRGGATVTPLRIAQLTIIVILLLVSTYLLVFAHVRNAGWWGGGFALMAIACVLSLSTFRERP